MVRRKGLEPLTYWFVASHSIQLSYRRMVLKCLSILAQPEENCKSFFQKSQIFFHIFPSVDRIAGFDVK